jgi:hypothetical protein
MKVAILGTLLDRDALDRPPCHRGGSPECPDSEAHVGLKPVGSDLARYSRMRGADLLERPLRKNLGTTVAELPIDDAQAGLAPLDLVVEVVVHLARGDVETHLAEAVRTGSHSSFAADLLPGAGDSQAVEGELGL